MDLTRQQDVVNGERLAGIPITIIGAGAVGSCVALALAKCGATDITVWDDDSVEPHNLPNQWFRMRDVGRQKVDALQEIVEDMTGVVLKTRNERFRKHTGTELTICCVDSMDVRIALWKQLKMLQPALYIDSRMGAEVGMVKCVGLASGWYEDTLYTSEEALPAPCTAKATMYCASGLAALIAAQVANYASDREIREETTFDFRNTFLM